MNDKKYNINELNIDALNIDEFKELVKLIIKLYERIEWLEQNCIVRIPNEGG